MPDRQPPPYRPDFYIPENIMGYTGKLHESPTVYFQCGAEFGRITQEYEVGYNLGREEVQSEFGEFKYVIENEPDENGKIVGHEKLVYRDTGLDWPSGSIHWARSEFKDISRGTMDTFAILAQAIRKFPALKTKGRRR